jgi:hypothetical protein
VRMAAARRNEAVLDDVDIHREKSRRSCEGDGVKVNPLNIVREDRNYISSSGTTFTGRY